MGDKSEKTLQAMIGKSLAQGGRLGPHGTAGASGSVVSTDAAKSQSVTHDASTKWTNPSGNRK